jgi:hypothetical protein
MANLLDKFTGSAGSTIASHTSDSGNTWTRFTDATGNFQLDGTGGVWSDNTTQSQNVAYSAWSAPADQRVRLKVGQASAAGTCSPCLRVSGTQNSNGSFYFLQINASGLSATIQREVNGAVSSLQSATITIGANDVWEFTCAGTNPVVLTAYQNGTQAITYSDSAANRITSGSAVGVRHPIHGPARPAVPGRGKRRGPHLHADRPGHR